jgi:PQQ-like domain
MKEDFVTRLELQLTKAERVQERGGPLPRLLAPVRAWRRPPLVAAGLAAAALVGVVALTHGGGDQDKVVARPPVVVARTWLFPTRDDTCTSACNVSDPFVGLASGFGSAWIAGLQDREVVRVGLDSRQVQARVPAGKAATDVLASESAVWVVVNPAEHSSTLMRIDPARNRVSARIPVDRVSVWPKLLGDDDGIWVLGEAQALRIDPRRGTVTGHITWNFGSGAFARAWGLAGDDLWARAEDGRLLRFDARTGARKGEATSPPGPASLAVLSDGGVVVAGEDGTLSRIDTATGRARWTTAPPERSVPTEQGSGRIDRAVAIAGGTAWVLFQNATRASEQLTAVDLATGKPVTGARMKDYGGAWLKAIGGELWYVAPQGYAVVVRP